MNAIWFVVLAMAAAPAVEKSPEPTTRLYVRTLPPGATVTVDSEPLGKSDDLFLVPPGVRKVTLDLDGYAGQTKLVEVREGRISRVEIELTEQSSGQKRPGREALGARPGVKRPSGPMVPGEAPARSQPSPILWVADDRVWLSYVDDTAEGKRSLAGSGHAVRFQRPADSNKLVAVEIFAARYGQPQPPEEDFHVYLLDEGQKVIKDIRFPYKEIERGDLRWYTLPVEPTEVPQRFTIALAFNPHQTKGIYLGTDSDVSESHSYTGLPEQGFTADEEYDWMIRAVLSPAPKSVEIH